jgi:hypothetical protein
LHTTDNQSFLAGTGVLTQMKWRMLEIKWPAQVQAGKEQAI